MIPREYYLHQLITADSIDLSQDTFSHVNLYDFLLEK